MRAPRRAGKNVLAHPIASCMWLFARALSERSSTRDIVEPRKLVKGYIHVILPTEPLTGGRNSA
jgi:hypothetical protein